MNTLDTSVKPIEKPKEFNRFSTMNTFKPWLTHVCQMIKPKEGLSALLKVAMSVNATIRNMFASFCQETRQVDLIITHSFAVISKIGLITRLQWWLCEPSPSKQKTACMFFYTTWSCLSLFKLDKINGSIVRIPTIDLGTISYMGGLIFNIWHNKKELDKANLQAGVNSERLASLKNKKIECASQKDREGLLASGENDAVAKRKIWMSLALDIANAGATILKSVGSYKDASFVNSRGMLLLNVTISGFWLYKCYYEEKHQDIKVYVPSL